MAALLLPLLVLMYPLTLWASEAEDEALMLPTDAASQAMHGDTPATAPQPSDPELPQEFTILGQSVAPGETKALDWQPNGKQTGLDTPNRILVVHGTKPGPRFCITAAIHGDEINGIEIVRRVIHNVRGDDLSGTIIGVPIVNQDGFRRSSRYLSDRRDLNRHFPGNPNGSAASRLAYALFHDIISHCAYLVDLHTGSFHRINLPQLRADLNRKEIRAFSKGFGGITVLNHEGSVGTLRYAAMEAGIPTVTLEAGGPLHLDKAVVDYGAKAIENALHTLKMHKLIRFWLSPKPTYYQSTWIRAESAGILISVVELGDKVSKLDVLGEVIDPITNRIEEIRAPFDGQILGMALDQFVSPGFAIYRIGIEREADNMTPNADKPAPHVPVDIDPGTPLDE